MSMELEPVRIVEYEADVGNGLWEHERVHMFLGRADGTDPAIVPDPGEVSETRWITPAALRAEIAADPWGVHALVPDLRRALPRPEVLSAGPARGAAPDRKPAWRPRRGRSGFLFSHHPVPPA